MAKSRKKRQEKASPLIPVMLVLLILIVVTVMDSFGHNPMDWLERKIYGGSSGCDDDLQVHFIDVGQGDCIYITADGVNMLIDSGEVGRDDDVISYLNSLGVKKLDYVVATHPHSDHMGCMSNIIDTYNIGTVIMPHLDDSDIPTTKYFERFLDSCEAKRLAVSEAYLGQIIEIGDARAEIIAPCSSSYSGANNYSVGIFLTHGRNSFIFTGDAEELSEKEMLENGRLGHVRVYKAGHHGSDTSSSEAFLEAISPEYAVISCGAGNSYGHPDNSTLKKLKKYTKEIYRTDLNGSIVFESDGLNLQIHTERKSK